MLPRSHDILLDEGNARSPKRDQTSREIAQAFRHSTSDSRPPQPRPQSANVLWSIAWEIPFPQRGPPHNLIPNRASPSHHSPDFASHIGQLIVCWVQRRVLYGEDRSNAGSVNRLDSTKASLQSSQDGEPQQIVHQRNYEKQFFFFFFEKDELFMDHDVFVCQGTSGSIVDVLGLCEFPLKVHA